MTAALSISTSTSPEALAAASIDGAPRVERELVSRVHAGEGACVARGRDDVVSAPVELDDERTAQAA
jgi:hypothetical protein